MKSLILFYKENIPKINMSPPKLNKLYLKILISGKIPLLNLAK